jgi:hypothetical protein
MATTLTTVSAGTVDAAALLANVEEVENYINGNIIAADLNASAFVKSEHVFAPEFFGSPAPRFEAVSGDTHFRNTEGTRTERAVLHASMAIEKWTPVPGLCATVKQSDPLAVRAEILASFYVWEFGGGLNTADPTHSEYELPAGRDVAYFHLRLDGVEIPGTTRRIANSVSDETGARFIARDQITMFANVKLTNAVHQIGVFCYIIDPAPYGGGATPEVANGDPKWKDIWFQGRNLIVDTYNLSLDP